MQGNRCILVGVMTLTIDLADPSHDTGSYRYITQPATQISLPQVATPASVIQSAIGYLQHDGWRYRSPVSTEPMQSRLGQVNGWSIR